MIAERFNVSDLQLLRFEAPRGDDPGRVTVFATESGIEKLRDKINAFQGELPKKKDGSDGRPKNADLAQSISGTINAIVEAGLQRLWRSPLGQFPSDGQAVPWEVWLEPDQVANFRGNAPEYGVAVGTDQIDFPEDAIVVATATRTALALAVRRLGGVRALAVPTITAEHFDEMEPEEQADWVDSLLERTSFGPPEQATYVTLLDRGVSRAHPLIAPALNVADRHASDPGWGVEDNHGHGTQLAGLSLYGDLVIALQNTGPIAVTNRLESAKIIPDTTLGNPHHLLGTVTRRGVDAVEAAADRRRTYVLANTTGQDTPHSGAPTSWSSELDQLCAGASGITSQQRLILVSAGNSDNNRYGAGNYLPAADHPDNEIESPAQAWNPICVGAFTEKSVLPVGTLGTPVAPSGDLSPSSRTASWTSPWPIKPDVVMEGGNWLLDSMPPPLGHAALSVLTTDRGYPLRSFAAVGDTSAATALAARQVAQLWSEYPSLWPETVRALFVGSARWNAQMRSHLPNSPNYGDYSRLFRRYGYGVPDMERARRSASNALTLVVQDKIVPYKVSDSGGIINNEMRLFDLPWPIEALRGLGASPVTLRVSLSSFIAPNPAEAARGGRYRYASHNLRFHLKRPGESQAVFLSRINAAADDTEEEGVDENDGWTFGPNRRAVGSLHIDELTCHASDLAQRNLLAVHPVTGWWKNKSAGDPSEKSVRFALVVEIDAEELEAELYAEVEVVIANRLGTVVMT
ncbi:MAG: S8 family peptidase [Devosia sp.]